MHMQDEWTRLKTYLDACFALQTKDNKQNRGTGETSSREEMAKASRATATLMMIMVCSHVLISLGKKRLHGIGFASYLSLNATEINMHLNHDYCSNSCTKDLFVELAFYSSF